MLFPAKLKKLKEIKANLQEGVVAFLLFFLSFPEGICSLDLLTRPAGNLL
jgi:hypothetical protein